MKHNKIIFLDIDGVVNLASDYYLKFNKEALLLLEHIIQKTGAKIVVSSSWRSGNLSITRNSFKDKGMSQYLLDQIVGETDRYHWFIKDKSYLSIVRGNEIKTWVDRNLKYPWHANPEMDAQYRENKEDGSFARMKSNVAGVDYSYVILDDDNDMLLTQAPYFVRTWDPEGLNLEMAEKAIQILNQIDKK